MENVRNKNDNEAVSYTHLDVYKRQLISRAKYLEPEMSEPQMVNKLAHYFGRGIQIAVITQGIK